MFVLGLPLAFPISVLMFFAGFIPYIGSAIVTLLGFLVAVAVGDRIDIILMAIFTIVFNIVQGNVVAPLVYGKTVSVHPAVVLLAAPAGGAIGGILGMVMIVPIIAIISRTWRIVIHLFDPEDAATAPAPPTAAAPAPSAGHPAHEGSGPGRRGHVTAVDGSVSVGTTTRTEAIRCSRQSRLLRLLRQRHRGRTPLLRRDPRRRGRGRERHAHAPPRRRPRVIVYPKDDHQPATFTVLNFRVAGHRRRGRPLTAKGVTFERYEGLGQDEKGVARQYPPPIAWFKDPAGNIVSLIQL